MLRSCEIAPSKRDRAKQNTFQEETMRHTGLILAAVVFAAAAQPFAGASIAQAQQKTALSIATGGTGGVYYPLRQYPDPDAARRDGDRRGHGRQRR
jgi:hypothetical protein